jgi:acyl dehydratase
VFVGDPLRFEPTVSAPRPSRSRPNAGVVVFEHRAYNQDGVLVCQGRRAALIRGGEA